MDWRNEDGDGPKVRSFGEDPSSRTMRYPSKKEPRDPLLGNSQDCQNVWNFPGVFSLSIKFWADSFFLSISIKTLFIVFWPAWSIVILTFVLIFYLFFSSHFIRFSLYLWFPEIWLGCNLVWFSFIWGWLSFMDIWACNFSQIKKF